MLANDVLKRYGFSIKLIDNNNFVQKIPDFEDNQEFIDKHELKFLGKNSYPDYLLYMKKEMEKYDT